MERNREAVCLPRRRRGTALTVSVLGLALAAGPAGAANAADIESGHGDETSVATQSALPRVALLIMVPALSSAQATQVNQASSELTRAGGLSGDALTAEIANARDQLSLLIKRYTAQQEADRLTALADPSAVDSVPNLTADRPTEAGAGGDEPTPARAGATASATPSLGATGTLASAAGALAQAAAPSATAPVAPADPARSPAAGNSGKVAEADELVGGYGTGIGVLAPRVTLGEVSAAANRLSRLLDAAARADGSGLSLAEQLARVVAKYAHSTDGYANGQIPESALCPLSFAPSQMLRCDAADRLEALNAEFVKKFHHPIAITDSYRPFVVQAELKAIKPILAAVPGTSQHGWGLAVDLGGGLSYTSAEYIWLRQHGPDYGWDNPAWARATGSKHEPWHFEFFAGGPMPTRYDAAEAAAAASAAEAGTDGSAKGTTPTQTPTPKKDGTTTPSTKPAPAPTSPNPTPSPTTTPSPTDAPTPATNAPTPTDAPSSKAPSSKAPSSKAPATNAPATNAPTDAPSRGTPAMRPTTARNLTSGRESATVSPGAWSSSQWRRAHSR